MSFVQYVRRLLWFVRRRRRVEQVTATRRVPGNKMACYGEVGHQYVVVQRRDIVTRLYMTVQSLSHQYVVVQRRDIVTRLYMSQCTEYTESVSRHRPSQRDLPTVDDRQDSELSRHRPNERDLPTVDDRQSSEWSRHRSNQWDLPTEDYRKVFTINKGTLSRVT